MSGFQVNHIALTVESLRQAENFYKRLFDLQLCFREGQTEEGWSRCPQTVGFEYENEVIPERCCLERDGLRILLLRRTDDHGPSGRIDHVCLQVEPEEWNRLCAIAAHLDCRIEQMNTDSWILEDPYGIRWWVTPLTKEGSFLVNPDCMSDLEPA